MEKPKPKKKLFQSWTFSTFSISSFQGRFCVPTPARSDFDPDKNRSRRPKGGWKWRRPKWGRDSTDRPENRSRDGLWRSHGGQGEEIQKDSEVVFGLDRKLNTWISSFNQKKELTFFNLLCTETSEFAIWLQRGPVQRDHGLPGDLEMPLSHLQVEVQR